jgi:hypothetical protein
LDILAELADGGRRYHDQRRSLDGKAHQVLTSTLRRADPIGPDEGPWLVGRTPLTGSFYEHMFATVATGNLGPHPSNNREGLGQVPDGFEMISSGVTHIVLASAVSGRPTQWIADEIIEPVLAEMSGGPK